jgi:hypothetical protein
VKIHPPLGGEGMIFMSGGDQIPVMIVCVEDTAWERDSDSDVVSVDNPQAAPGAVQEMWP